MEETFRQTIEHANFHYDINYRYNAGQGLSPATIDYISDVKGDAPWIREFRHKALRTFLSKKLPEWAQCYPILQQMDYNNIHYYLANDQIPKTSWENVPDDVKETFERLGVPENERKFLAGVEAQFDSESAYSHIQSQLAQQGIIFVNSTEGLNRYGSIFRPYFGTVVPIDDNKFSALNSAVFRGGSFIYIPKGVKVQQPL